MHDESRIGESRRSDRRHRPTSPLDAFRLRGRRRNPRRGEERTGAYFVDRFDVRTLALIVALLGLTIVDGVLTIELVDLNSEEANPVMAHLLGLGGITFLMGKYLLTAAGIPFLVVYQHYPLFRSRFRVGALFPVFVTLYLVLLFHQWTLFHAGCPNRAAIARASAAGALTTRTHKSSASPPLRARAPAHDDGPSCDANPLLPDPGIEPGELPECLRPPDSPGDERAASTFALSAMRRSDPGSR